MKSETLWLQQGHARSFRHFARPRCTCLFNRGVRTRSWSNSVLFWLWHKALQLSAPTTSVIQAKNIATLFDGARENCAIFRVGVAPWMSTVRFLHPDEESRATDHRCWVSGPQRTGVTVDINVVRRRPRCVFRHRCVAGNLCVHKGVHEISVGIMQISLEL
jgi:hypothetical protein